MHARECLRFRNDEESFGEEEEEEIAILEPVAENQVERDEINERLRDM